METLLIAATTALWPVIAAGIAAVTALASGVVNAAVSNAIRGLRPATR